jgi:hypothetical protein
LSDIVIVSNLSADSRLGLSPEKLADTENADNQQEADGEVDQRSEWFSIICGSLTNLPEMPSNVVRVFISSTFSGQLNFVLLKFTADCGKLML